LQNPGENGEIKPPILLCFGDIALAIGPLFEKFLPIIMESLKQAARATTYAEFDVDVHEFLTQLKESVIITWSCIVQAFAGEKGKIDSALCSFHVRVYMWYMAKYRKKGEDITIEISRTSW